MKQTTGSTNKEKINALMRVLGVRNFQQAEKKLCIGQGTISRVFHGKKNLSPACFLKAAIVMDMRPSELMEKLGIERKYFWDGGR